MIYNATVWCDLSHSFIQKYGHLRLGTYDVLSKDMIRWILFATLQREPLETIRLLSLMNISSKQKKDIDS